MIKNNLFEKILLNPLNDNCDSLIVLSGYASANMVTRHFELIDKINSSTRIKLFVGMTVQDGITVNNHNLFRRLVSYEYPTRFECNYNISAPPIHSKIYLWLKKQKPHTAFLGSANYTQKAFSNKQAELMDECDPLEAFNYIRLNSKLSMDCTNKNIYNHIPVIEDIAFEIIRRKTKIDTIDENASKQTEIFSDINHIKVSLVNLKGEVHNAGGGLNWGQRPGREPNQAYIALRPSIYKSSFFPEKNAHFSVITDDGKSIVCSRTAKRYGEEIHSALNNSDLGTYFRRRLGLVSGAFIHTSDLVKYGRKDVDFYKIDDYTYLMDFSN